MIDFNLVAANGSVETRAFKRKSDASRYAKKHNLTIAETNAATALVALDTSDVDAVLASINDIATDTDANDVDAVLASLDSVTGDDATATLRERALAFDQTAVDAMIADIEATFAARDLFEGDKATDTSSSYAKARKNMLANKVAVARGMLALNVKPVNVIRRKVVSGAEFSAKALDKVTEICGFICGNASRFQKVTQAFIACSIAVSDRETATIGNRVNKAFLSNASFDRLVTDSELATYLRDYQHKYMSGGTDTQSSQVRNVLDVLNLATIVTVDHARGGIEIDRDHDFYALFRERYMTAA